MIPRIIRGGDVDGLVRYLYGPGRANEHSGPRLVDGWRPAETIEPHMTSKGIRDLRPLIQKLYAPNELMRTPQREYVWHVPISAGRAVQSRDGYVGVEADRPLTDEEFKELARDILHRTGVAPRGDEQGCRWILVRHDEGQDGQQHAHLVATLARQDGGRCDAGNDWIKANDAVIEFQQRHPDLRRIRKARSSADKIPAREKVEKAARFRQRVCAMETLQREAYAARAAASSPAEYLRGLASARGAALPKVGEGSGPLLIDVKVRLPGQPELMDIKGLDNSQLQTAVGYALHRVGDIGSAGKPIYYRGGALGQDLSLGQLKDRGCQYTSLAFGRRCHENGIASSMGRTGTCYDNAMAESFFATLETELLMRRSFANRSDARLAVFDYIEGFYNTHRRHSALEYLSPSDFERRHQAKLAITQPSTVH